MEDNIDKGIITQIYLENFVTYDKVTVKPTRYLNVIVGPNGSGKSTIVAAIILGLGGKPNIIGRAHHVGEYVKYGRETAKIEIYLKNGGGKRDIVISRIFTNQGKTNWMINGVSSNTKSVLEFTSSLNIQVDNLCQFLPQDKVQDFSKMDPQALLENTERSVGDPNILLHHQRLKELRSEFKELETCITYKKRLLESNTQKRDGLQQTVSTIKERTLIKKKIVTLKQKKAWMLYDQTRRRLVESKKCRDAAGRKLQATEAKLKPVKEKIDKIKSDMTKLKNTLNSHNDRINNKKMKLRNMMDEVFGCETRIKEAENKCLRKIQIEENRDQEINCAQQQRSKLENDLSLVINKIGLEENLTKQLENIATNMEEHRKIINKLTNDKISLKNEEEGIDRQVRALQADRQRLNIDTKRLDVLRQKSVDAYRGVLWLRQNTDKFSGTVHEPMLLNINIKEASYAKYLENIIPIRDLIAFTCEDKQDMKLLLMYLRDQQQLQINVVHSDPMKRVSAQPNIPLENLIRFGFKHYLVSLIEAPPTIMKYLISMYQLHNIPVGTSEVEDNTDRIPRTLQCYFSHENIYSVSTSKYTHAVSTRISRVTGNGTLSIVSDKHSLEKLEEQLQNLQEKKSQIVNYITQMENNIREETKKMDGYRSNRTKIQQDIQHIQGLKGRIRMATDRINQMETERTSINDIKTASNKDIKAILKKQLQLYKEYIIIQKEHFKSITSNEEVKFALTLLEQNLLNQENDAAELKDKYKTAEFEFKQHDEEYQPLKGDAERLYIEALQSTNNISPRDDAFRPLNKAFEKLPATIAEINNELNVSQAKVFCMAKNVDAESVLREYGVMENNIQMFKKYIAEKTDKIERIAKEIEELKEKWLQPLQQLIEKINTNFSSYFAAMDCAGEVTLSHGENPMDFNQYGLKIRVKFRDTDELQELTRHFQSGGERTVTTAIYMIALQELSRVPFRCVDEINQGMDAVNERRVFNLLVKMTGRPGSSQYFLLTPKLLSKLTYAKTVTVHNVFNGPLTDVNDEELNFDIEAYCNILRSNSIE